MMRTQQEIYKIFHEMHPDRESTKLHINLSSDKFKRSQ